MNKRGVLGLETARAFIVLILVVAVIAFTAIIALSTLRPTAQSLGAQFSDTETNETISINESGDLAQTLNATRLGHTNLECTLVHILNASTVVPSTNYSFVGSDCSILFAGDPGEALNASNSLWNITYTWTAADAAALNVLQNVSGGVESFFEDSDTWFTLLSIVVIILVIAIIIVAVGSFGGTTRAVGGGGGATGNVITGGRRSTDFEGL